MVRTACWLYFLQVVSLGYQGWAWLYGVWYMVLPEEILPGKWNIFCISFNAYALQVVIGLNGLITYDSKDLLVMKDKKARCKNNLKSKKN